MSNIHINGVMDFNEIRGRIYPQLTNAAQDLTNRPHKMLDDMAVTYYVLLDSDDDCTARVLICDNLLTAWGITLEELHNTAVANIKPDIIPLNTLLGLPADIAPIQILVVSNTSRAYGASAVLDHETRRKISEFFGGDYIILPSSIHEVLCIGSDAGMDYTELANMVQAVNASEVAEKEQLSNHAYIYDSATDTIKTV